MKHVSDLAGMGSGARCVIIGGGHSLADFAFDSLGDCYIISTNNHKTEIADMVIYYDGLMQNHFTSTAINHNIDLVGFKNNKIDHTIPRCDYYYSYDDIIFGDTGFHSLQMADKIFNFDEIYLAGYDYSVRGKSYHYEETVSDAKRMEKFTVQSIGRVKGMYEQYEQDGKKIKMVWNNKIFNCNEKSGLTTFEYKLPY